MTFQHTLPLALVLASLSLGGCSYSTAMRQGDKAAAAGEWREAVSGYGRAIEVKAKPEAAEAFAYAREEAIQLALDDALTEIELGGYETSMSHIEYVSTIDSDNPDVFSLRSDLRAAMNGAIENNWSVGNVRTAYTTAVRMRALFPGEQEQELLFAKLRDHFVQASKEHLAGKRYEDALASAATIVEFEPDRAAHTQALEHTIRVAWADDLNAQAASHLRARRKGAASLLHARAYEIAGRQPDLARAQDLAHQLADAGRFEVALKITGSGDRAAQIRDVVDQLTAAIPDVGDAARPTLTVNVSAAGARCTEEKSLTPESKDYISGQIEVPNPLYAELTDRLEHSTHAATASKAESERLWPEVQKAERSLAFFDDLVGLARQQHTAASGELQTAQRQIEKIAAAQAEIEAHLAELRAVGPGTEATIAKRESDLGKVAGLYSEWQGQMVQAERKASDAQRELNNLELERAPAATAMDRIRGGYQVALDDWTNYQKIGSEAKAQLAQTPTTIWEDVPETLHYDVVSWTRTCSAPVSVSLRPTWDTHLSTSNQWNPTQTTRDSSHIGHVAADVTEDPKAYPDSDAELFARSDAETAAALGGWIAELVEEHYELRTMNTTMALQKDPLAAADAMLALYLGATGHLEESTALTFRSYAAQNYGLETLDLLRGERNEGLARR